MESAVKTPHPEQVLAIHHSGGKILSAGAGSGKTFVLIEHMIAWLSRLKTATTASDWPQVIPAQLPKIVLMTFTKKAAGEMSIRMMKRLDGLCLEGGDEKEREFWLLVRQYLPLMNITTISSFCHQLISEGDFTNSGRDIQILSKLEYDHKISRLFDLWFVSKKDGIEPVFKANAKALIKGMIDIYSSPELRILWREPLVKGPAENELDSYITHLVSSLKLNEVFEVPMDLAVPEKEREKPWVLLLRSFDDLIKRTGALHAQNFRDYLRWTENVPSPFPRENKTMSMEQLALRGTLKKLVAKMREVEEDLLNLIEHHEIFWSWAKTLKEVYDFIEENYFLEKGFSFADLEYYVCLGLRNPKLAEKIKKRYDYFIVDEFQDTSSIQYEIIQHLIGDRPQRLFCVGDRKQAIYGFRGGELLVFKQCAEMLGTENNIWLKNNFRSHEKIIQFNNELFEKIFPLGHGFEGYDEHAVSMEAQTAPTNANEGQIEKITADIGVLGTEKKVDWDAHEARALFQTAQRLLSDDSEIDTVCVLYRKLRPSSLLLDLLVERGLSFSAQVKVQYGEDPIIGLFLRSIELKMNKDHPEKLATTHFLMDALLEVLGTEVRSKTVEEVFLGDLETLGLRLAFHKLVYSLGLSNSQYAENGQLIDSLCRVCKEDPFLVFNLLCEERDGEYSLEMMNGTRGKRVIIMTAHASKGLEFDAVLLGGLYSNGSQMGKTEVVGKLPKSFRWKKVYNQKKFYKSPVYYYEAELDRAREFSESKRLLYVACTRAVKYLGWIDLAAGEEVLSPSGESHWIKAMRFMAHSNLLSESRITLAPSKDKKDLKIPLLLKDSFGLKVSLPAGALGIFAETSVTSLAQLAQCSFKFYLANICKLTPPGKMVMADGEADEGEETFYSSKDRGTKIHSILSQLILSEGKSVHAYESASDREKVEWAMKEVLEAAKGKVLHSEKQIKFSLFGQMISGTPDLVFEGPEDVAIWDFKTGERHPDNEEGYWFQLTCYAHAYTKLKHFTPEKRVSLSLLYLDQKEVVSKPMSTGEISEFLFENWVKLESLNRTNLVHCSHCDYSSICVHHKRSLLSCE